MATMTTTTLTAAVGAKDLQIPLAAVTDVVAQGPPLFTETTLFCQREAMTVRTFSGLVVRVARGAMGTQATGHPSGATVYIGPTTAYGLSQPSGTFSMPQGGYTPLVVVTDGTIWGDVSGSWGQVGGDSGVVDAVFGRTGFVVAAADDYTFAQIAAGTSAKALVIGTGGSLAATGSGTIAATSVPAAGIAAGTNANALVIGTGGSLAASGSGTITATAAPVSGISGLGANVATFLATPSSANLAAALTDETGTGANVFADTPTLIAPILGTPTSGTLTNCTIPVGGVSGLGAGWATALATVQAAKWSSVPASAGAAGTAGQAAYESGFLYICVATNTWERVAIATWP